MAAGVGKKSTICLHSTGPLGGFFCAGISRDRGGVFCPIAISGAGLRAVLGLFLLSFCGQKKMGLTTP